MIGSVPVQWSLTVQYSPSLQVGGVRGAVVAPAVAALGDVAAPRRGATGRGPRGGGRTGRAAAGAALGRVADSARGAADRAARLEGVGRAVVADAVAALGHVAHAGGGTTDGGRKGVVRGKSAALGAGLGLGKNTAPGRAERA